MRYLSIVILLFFSSNGIAQNFYVEETDKGYHLPITDKLVELGKIITDKNNSTYTIKCVITKESGYGKAAKGHIQILDSKSGLVLLQSASEKGMRNAFKGMQNPKTLLFKRIAKNQLPKLLIQLESIKTPTSLTVKENVSETDSKTKEEKLVELKQLYEKQLITKEEYEAEKKKILGGK